MIIKQYFKSPHFIRGVIALTAAIIMHYIPENIDDIIKVFLLIYGISDLYHLKTKEN